LISPSRCARGRGRTFAQDERSALDRPATDIRSVALSLADDVQTGTSTNIGCSSFRLRVSHGQVPGPHD
jgi:hypothetical protein